MDIKALLDKSGMITACLEQNIAALYYYRSIGVNFNNIYDKYGFSLLHLAILNNKPLAFETLITLGMNIETPSYFDATSALNLAARQGSVYYLEKLLALGADVNSRDRYGYTPLNNAMFYKKFDMVEKLLNITEVDVNIPAENGFPPIFFAYKEENWDILHQIMQHAQYDATYHQILLHHNALDLKKYLLSKNDNINENTLTAYQQSKLFGLKYGFDGCFNLKEMNEHQHNCFSFEGYGQEIGMQDFSVSFNRFLEEMQRVKSLSSAGVELLMKVQDTLNFSAKVWDPYAYVERVALGDAVLISTGWKGHAIDVVIQNNKFYRCNRGNLSDKIHGIEEYNITKPEHLTADLFQKLLTPHNNHSDFIQKDLIDILGLERTGEVKTPEQIVGNCVWTSHQAGLEALFITVMLEQGFNNENAHEWAKSLFLLWEEFDLTFSIKEVIKYQDIFIQNEVYDDLLLKVLDLHHNSDDIKDIQKGVMILNELDKPLVFDAFDQEIGQYVYHYDPLSYHTISYMKNYAPSYFYNIKYWFFSENHDLTPAQYEKAKQYHDFLKACDTYQQQTQDYIVTIDDVLNTPLDSQLSAYFYQETPKEEPSTFFIAQQWLAMLSEHIAMPWEGVA